MMATTTQTVQQLLIDHIRQSAVFNPNGQKAPVCILWPDKDRQWESVIPSLQGAMPDLLVLGDYAPDRLTGPAIWIKCVIAGTLEDVSVPEGLIPIIYLPGISRTELRAIEQCPDSIKPLAELQYRGALWSQHNGKDWTAFAFLTSEQGGLGLDVAGGIAAKEALSMALEEVLRSTKNGLANKLLEASDFNQLLTSDPVRDLLAWMNSPKDIRDQWGKGRWKALCDEVRSGFNLDIESEGDFAAAEKLCAGDGAWNSVWQRYDEAPQNYPDLFALLERVPLPDMFADAAKYPQANSREEATLLKALSAITGQQASVARNKLLALEKVHGIRRESVWAKLGNAPWAVLLETLAEVANRTQKALGGLSPQELGKRYADEGWRVDNAAIQAIAMCTSRQQRQVVETVLKAIYTPWLADLNERFQKHVLEKGYPGQNKPGEKNRSSEAVAGYKKSGEVVFFVDGLRLDVAHQLKSLLDREGFKPHLSTQWSALPSVTATAKAAVSPLYKNLIGLEGSQDFGPSVVDGGSLTHDRFKKELSKQGWQHLSEDDLGDPHGNAWVACGDIDKEGHKSELKLPGRIPMILEGIVDRIIELQQAGWQKIRIVTDHGWLLVPGKMPKSDLPVQAAESRWGRCAQLKQNVEVEGLTIGWHWNPNTPIHFPHGIHSFIAGRTYGHGGVSLQECLVPVLTIEGEAKLLAKASITAVRWVGLTCKVEVQSESTELSADLRTKLADSRSSLVNAKQLKQGKASLMVLEDGNEGLGAIVVIYDNEGNVLAKQATTVGGDD